MIGAGNGGKAAAADLALRGMAVCLSELPEYSANLDDLAGDPVLHIEGALCGTARLARVTPRPDEAAAWSRVVVVCTQAMAHEPLASCLAGALTPEHVLVLNPGSTGGSLRMARRFRELGMRRFPVLAEFSTLTYGCRARGSRVSCPVRVSRVVWGAFPARETERVAPLVEPLFHGLVRGRHVLEAGLNNANPVIHPAIALLNAARIEQEGERMRFYADGVSPAVARLIAGLDAERMALLRALGCPAQPDPVTSVQQGYAEESDYLRCYRDGAGFGAFRSPGSLDHRFLHEDVGIGLVLYCGLGRQLGVPTPVSRAVVEFASAVAGVDYPAREKGVLARLGLEGLGAAELQALLENGFQDSAPSAGAEGSSS